MACCKLAIRAEILAFEDELWIYFFSGQYRQKFKASISAELVYLGQSLNQPRKSQNFFESAIIKFDCMF